MGQVSSRELIALTSLRGIAALFVLLHHLMFVAFPPIGYSMPGQLFLKSYLWVDLFFVLSGFIIAYVYQGQFAQGVASSGYSAFMKARFARVYPLHLFTLGLFVAFEGFQWALAALDVEGMQNLAPPFVGNQSVETLVTNLFLVQTFHWEAYWNEPAWSISAEWLIYWVMPFLIAGIQSLTPVRQVLLATTAFIPLILIERNMGDLGLLFAGWPMLFRCLAGAVLGMLMFQCFRNGRLTRLCAGQWVLPVFALNLALLYLEVPDVLSVAGFALLVLCAARVPGNASHPLNHPWLYYLGQISYSVYLVHWLFLDIIREASRFLAGKPIHEVLSSTEQWVMLVVIIVLVLAASHWTYHRVEVPMRRYLKRSLFKPATG